MHEWMKQRDLLIEETLEFVQGVASNFKDAQATQPHVKAGTPDTLSPVVAKVPAPADKLDLERASILRRVADFKANQQRFQREREEYFAGTMAMLRANRWPIPQR